MTGKILVTIRTDDVSSDSLPAPEFFEEQLFEALEEQQVADEFEVEGDTEYVHNEMLVMMLEADPSTGADYTQEANAVSLATDVELPSRGTCRRPTT